MNKFKNAFLYPEETTALVVCSDINMYEKGIPSFYQTLPVPSKDHWSENIYFHEFLSRSIFIKPQYILQVFPSLSVCGERFTGVEG